MVFSSAAQVFQMHAVLHPAQARVANRVARFVRSPIHAEAFPAELQHLRHERKPFQFSIFVQSGENLLLGAHVDNFASVKTQFLATVLLGPKHL